MRFIKIPSITPWLVPALLAATLGCDASPEETAPRPSREPAPNASAIQAPDAKASAANAEAPRASDASSTDEAVAPPRQGSKTSTASEAAIDPALAERLRIKRLVVATSVDQREPQGAAESFGLEGLERVYAFVEVENPSRSESEVVVTFEPPDGTKAAPTGHVTLSVGASPRWRTWAFTRGIHQPGEWTAVVTTPTGKELARQSFLITEA